MGTILLIGTLDTKGEEYAFTADLIRARGHEVLLVDVGVMENRWENREESPAGEILPAVTASEVARAGGSTLEELRAKSDRGVAVDTMASGVKEIVRQLHRERRFDAVLGMGGGGGSTIISAAMRELPVGVPKLLVSTMAAGDTTPYVDVRDITMMYPVVDIAGLNPLSRRILANAAGAVCGMADAPLPPSAPHRPLVAATMFGVTTPCVTMARKRLETAGYDVLVFHATGSGGRAMEGLIADGYFQGVLDVTTTEWCDEVVGGVLSAGPERLAAAARAGIPQVVSVGALDMVNFGAYDSVPPRFSGRTFYRHNATVTLMRTTAEECREIGQRIGEQLTRASAPVVLLLPLRGVSMIDGEGQPFHDPEANRALFDSLRAHCGRNVRIRELDAHINDAEFANALADELLALMP
jgi:uncharacterized protein (UPF0261 family)